MADQLRRVIYHEKQEPDSNLCAQHALNNLLQQGIFTAPDLATIARRLDSSENAQLDRARTRSMNMDDSGFFSVQVLEEALQVWGLTLTRWRSEAMKEYLDKPHVLLGFILNLELHWFTLRRFGPAEPELSQDQGIGHWFNLNSFLKEPEWVSKTYLGIMLQQAETEGYSVFAVCQMDPLGPLALSRTKADEIAVAIPEITSASKNLSTSRQLSSSSGGPSGWTGAAGFEDDDPELQAALLASVLGAEASVPLPSSAGGRVSDTLGDDWDIGNARSAFGSQGATIPLSNIENTRSSLEQIQRDLANFQAARTQTRGPRSNSGMSPTQATSMRSPVLGSPAVPAPATRRPRAPREDEEEEEMVRRAIAASRQEQEERENRGPDDDTDEEALVYLDDEDQHMYDEGEEEREELERLLRERRERQREEQEHEQLRQQFGVGSSSAVPPAASFDPFETGMFGANATHLDRHYDDEDAELQAALRASLEGIGEELTVPPPPKAPTKAPTRAETPPTTSKATNTKKPVVVEEEEEEDSEEESEEEETESEAPPSKPLTAEEMRKARLARFG